MTIRFYLLPLLLLVSTLSFAQQASYEEIPDKNTLKILTPSLKERKTAKLRLDNGLEAYLISDPGADQSGAALSMEAGSWSDPDTYPGMAHFLEHLLFMGSETYPDENGYERQVFDHGGVLNAYTAPDRTVYIFSINHDAYTATLDQFAHMFIDPLFSASGVGRELHAVDQENDKNLENDFYRLFMVFKETGNPHHPNARFLTGNAETLKGIPREEVMKWHRENYSADKAHLVLYSNLPLSELKELTATYFSKVPLTASPKPRFPERLSSSYQEGHLIVTKPVKDIRTLSLNWELPQDHVLNLENNSHALLAYLLRSKHPGGLYDQLKKEELIEDVSAGMSRWSKESALFSLDFDLTPQGVHQFETIIERSFQALNQVKKQGIPGFVFDEMKTMAEVDYEYQSRETPFLYVQNLADLLTKEPLATFPQKTCLPTAYNRQQNAALLDLLTPKNASYFLTASPELTQLPPEKTEKWSGAEYAIRKIDQGQLKAWSNPEKTVAIALPEPNPYIPNNLKLVSENKQFEETPHPLLIADNEAGKVYFWEDANYLTPDVSWSFHFKTPQIDGSAKHSVLTDLFLRGVERETASTLSYAEAASLSTSCYTKDLDFILRIDGKSEKASKLLKTLLSSLKNSRLTKEEFEIECTSLSSIYGNFEKAMPVSQSIEIMRNLFFNIFPRQREKLAALQTLSYEDYLAFSERLFQQTYIEAMLTGNLSQTEALKVWETTKNSLHAAPYPKEQQAQKQILVLSKHHGPYKIFEESQSLGNAALLVLQEGPFSFEKNASASVLGTALKEEFFTTLRTKQQTAYIAKVHAFEEEDQLMKLFLVQSSSHQPDELIARFELFLETYIKDFETALPEGRFEEIRTNLITLLKTPPPNLSGMAGHLDILAFTYRGDFDRTEKEIEALKKLDYAQLKQDTLAFLSRRNSKRVAIMLEGQMPKDKQFRYEDITAERMKTQGTYISLP